MLKVTVSTDGSWDFGSPSDLSANVLSLRLLRGQPDPLHRVALGGAAVLTLPDPDGAYLPENGGAAYIGNWMRISYYTASTHYALAILQISDIAVDERARVVTLRASSALAANPHVALPTYQDTTTDAIVRELLMSADLTTEYYDGTDYNGIYDDANSKYGQAKYWELPMSLDAGRELSYFYGADDVLPLIDALERLCALEWGHFFTDRNGTFQFCNRSRLNRAADFSLDENQLTELSYGYAGTLANSVTAFTQRTRLQGAATVYQAEQPLLLRREDGGIGGVRRLPLARIESGRLRLSFDAQIFADSNLVLRNGAGSALTAGTWSVFFRNRGSFIELAFQSPVGSAYLDPFALTCDGYIVDEPLLHLQTDFVSQSQYGYRPLTLEQPFADEDDADEVVSYIVQTRAYPRGEIDGFTLTPHSVAQLKQAQMDIGDLVSLDSTRLGHAAVYRIYAIEHLFDGRWLTRYKIEPDSDAGAVFDTSDALYDYSNYGW